MPTFKLWDVVKVPFPYTNRPVKEYRPALIVRIVEEGPGLLWVLMITSAENRSWPGDVPIRELKAAGLPAASVVRTAKVATIDAEAAYRLGSLAANERVAVAAALPVFAERM